MPRVTVTDTASGSLFGLAYGDALGKPTEFRRYDQITAEYGRGGPRELPEPALVTDDTQMALAVGWALREASAPTPEALEPLLRARFLAWAKSPENNRAPGMTCLNACANLATGMPWQRATVAGSKGCGANMRVTPVGLVPEYDLDTLAGIAQLQAGLTHGHPTGLAAAELTALAVRLPRDGAALADLPGLLRERCAEQRTVYRADWLGDLWQRPGVTSPEEFIARGWDECADVLDTLLAALRRPDSGGDVCRETGEGWIAEEALASALLAALRHPDDPVAALGRAAATSGDSDSIACLAGAFHGAASGMAIWPASWADRIEYADQLATLGAAWD
nr:ADP-ribosylglycohydrolase family protein [Catellatospora sp. IY07-71]